MIAKFSNIFTRWESICDSNEIVYSTIDELLEEFPKDSLGNDMTTNGVAYIKKDNEYVPLYI